jgi:hypothetical protein
MKITIEFYRTRDSDSAHAVVARETAEAADIDDAVGIARQLSRTLDMPQQADALTIIGVHGLTLHTEAVVAEENREGKAST